MKDAIQAKTLEDYFQSEAGRAALSRKGKAERLNVLGTMQEVYGADPFALRPLAASRSQAADTAGGAGGDGEARRTLEF